MNINESFWANTRIVYDEKEKKSFVYLLKEDGKMEKLEIYKKAIINTSVVGGISLLPGKVFVVTENGNAYIEKKTAEAFQSRYSNTVRNKKDSKGKFEILQASIGDIDPKKSNEKNLYTKVLALKSKVDAAKNMEQGISNEAKDELKALLKEYNDSYKLLQQDLDETNKQNPLPLLVALSNGNTPEHSALMSLDTTMSQIINTLNTLGWDINSIKTIDEVSAISQQKTVANDQKAQQMLSSTEEIFKEISGFFDRSFWDRFMEGSILRLMNSTYKYPVSDNDLSPAAKKQFSICKDYEADLKNIRQLLEENSLFVKLLNTNAVKSREDELSEIGKNIEFIEKILNAQTENELTEILRTSKHQYIQFLIAPPRSLVVDEQDRKSLEEIKKEVVRFLYDKIKQAMNTGMLRFALDSETVIQNIDTALAVKGDYSKGIYLEFITKLKGVRQSLIGSKEQIEQYAYKIGELQSRIQQILRA